MRVGILTFLLLLCFFTFVLSTNAQPLDSVRRLEQQINTLENEAITRDGRLLNLETRMAVIEALALDHRLTKLETISETNRTMLLATISGIVMLLIEAATRLMRRQSREVM